MQGSETLSGNAYSNYSSGWVLRYGIWYYYENGQKLKRTWKRYRGDWYYLDDDGEMVTNEGWQEDDKHNCYYVGSDKKVVTGWKQINDKWYYFDSHGKMKIGWIQENVNWYYLDDKGGMQTGWRNIGGKWYYLNSKGDMKIGWLEIDGNWYYLNSSGVMQTGWQTIDGEEYYLNSNGQMATGTVTINGKDYNFDSNGQLQSDSISSILGPTLEEAAEIAKHVYFIDGDAAIEETSKHPLPGGWKLTDYRNNNSSLQIGVYERTINGKTEYVLANRGSRMPSFEHQEYVADWINNAEQVLGKSQDVVDSMAYVDEFLKKHPNSTITFVGHSKGGADALINAILFNPAAANLEGVGLPSSDYHGTVLKYVVKGEILDKIEGIFEQKFITKIYLPTQHPGEPVKNHFMDAVISAIKEGKQYYYG